MDKSDYQITIIIIILNKMKSMYGLDICLKIPSNSYLILYLYGSEVAIHLKLELIPSANGASTINRCDNHFVRAL